MTRPNHARRDDPLRWRKRLHYLPFHISGVMLLVLAGMNGRAPLYGAPLAVLGVVIGIQVPVLLYQEYRRGYNDLRLLIMRQVVAGYGTANVDLSMDAPHPALLRAAGLYDRPPKGADPSGKFENR